VSIVFFVRQTGCAMPEERDLPAGTSWRIWRPGDESTNWRDPLHLAVTIQHRLGLFEDDRYREISVWDQTVRVHRLIVTPRWHRFPFMAAADLQIGAVWTHPAWRQRGLARSAIERAHRLFGAPGQRFWYVTDGANGASMALAQSAGYRVVGEGRRTKRIGIALLGQFKLDRDYAAT
jgi:RimJ/RimL family protein N-acetyltransferase